MYKVFSLLFILTGIFAILGGLYTWGEGSILLQGELIQVLIPWADIVVTGPISIICGIGLRKRSPLGILLGLTTSGIYILGSVMVFITMIWNQQFLLTLFVPAASGFLIGVGYIVFCRRNVTMSLDSGSKG